MPTTLDDVASLIEAGELEKAADRLETVAASEEDRAEKYYLEGWLHQNRCEIEQAIQAYHRALEKNPGHPNALFRLAYLYDLRGQDRQAIDLYERLIQSAPAPVHALLNLALLYEENGCYRQAKECLTRILDEYPTHARAHLFMKDLEATMTMVYDDEAARKNKEQHLLLDTPLGEFELSMRSRNCLKQMNIHTLGDLLRVSEADLLTYKNFGETSLNEIKIMLTQKGLKIGQLLDAHAATSFGEGAMEFQPPAGDPALLSRSVSELELSVRSRRCLQRLGITTLGELVLKSESELLSTKNFGQTSLEEIKKELAEYNLRLRSTK